MKSIVEKLSDEPIILVRVRPHPSASTEVAEVAAACAALIKGDGPTYRITDFSVFHLTFSGLVEGMADETRGLPGSLSDPRLRNIFVGAQDTVELGAQSFKQAQYGGLEITLLATLDAAVEYARRQMTVGV